MTKEQEEQIEKGILAVIKIAVAVYMLGKIVDKGPSTAGLRAEQVGVAIDYAHRVMAEADKLV